MNDNHNHATGLIMISSKLTIIHDTMNTNERSIQLMVSFFLFDFDNASIFTNSFIRDYLKFRANPGTMLCLIN